MAMVATVGPRSRWRPRRRLRLVGEPKSWRLARIALEWQRTRDNTLRLVRENYPQLPRTRAECAGAARPCPYVSCRHHLGLEVARRTGQLRLSLGPELERGELPDRDTCSLDVAERGPHSQEQIAEALGCTIEWVRQTERSAEAQMRVAGGSRLRAVLSDYAEDPAHHAPRAGALAEVAIGCQSPDRGDPQADEARDLDLWTDRAAALMLAGVPARAAWALANEMANAMGRPKGSRNRIRTTNGATEPASGDSTLREYSQDLAIECTAEQLAEYACELAEVVCEVERLDEERARFARAQRDQRKPLEALQSKIAHILESGRHLVPVDCRDLLLAGGTLRSVRLDTGEVLGERPASAEERQRSMFAETVGDE